MIVNNLQGFLRLMTIGVSGAKIGRLTLYAFENFYMPNCEVRIALELERVRGLMRRRAKAIYSEYDAAVRSEIENLRESLKEPHLPRRKDIEVEIKKLEAFLDFPGPLEIRNAALEEIANRFRARNVKTPLDLNRLPEDGIFRIALRDCTIEGYRSSQSMHVNIVPFNSEHFLTFALNARFLSEEAAEQVRGWWDFTVRTMGVQSARFLRDGRISHGDKIPAAY